jgi:hypothetical protein
MILTIYMTGATLSALLAAYLLKTQEVGWVELAPPTVTAGVMWPIAMPAMYTLRTALMD